MADSLPKALEARAIPIAWLETNNLDRLSARRMCLDTFPGRVAETGVPGHRGCLPGGVPQQQTGKI
jgi:hypothetical protein